MTEYMDIYKYPNIKKCHMIRQINVERGKTRATGTRTDRQIEGRDNKKKEKSIKNLREQEHWN